MFTLVALTLSDLADAHINLSLRCVACGHHIVQHSRIIMERIGDMRMDRFIKRAKCSACKRASVEIIMVVTPGYSPEAAAMRVPRWSQHSAFLTIDQCEPGSFYSTLLGTHNHEAAYAAWNVFKDLHPRSELTLRHGAYALETRPPLVKS